MPEISHYDYRGLVMVGIDNKGLGPMKIVKVDFRLKEKTSENILDILQYSPNELTNCSTDFAGRVIPSGKRLQFVKLSSDDDAKIELLRNKLKDVEIVVKYKDVLGFQRKCKKNLFKWYSMDNNEVPNVSECDIDDVSISDTDATTK